MTRRAFLAAVLALMPLPVAADMDGARRKRRADERCRRMGVVRERHGLTERERATLDREGCKKVGDGWLSAGIYQA